MSEHGIPLQERIKIRGGHMKGLNFATIDDNIYEEEEKIQFAQGVAREFKPGMNEDRQNVTRQRDPFYDD